MVSLQYISHKEKLATLSFQTALLQHRVSVLLGQLREIPHQTHRFNIVFDNGDEKSP